VSDVFLSANLGQLVRKELAHGLDAVFELCDRQDGVLQSEGVGLVVVPVVAVTAHGVDSGLVELGESRFRRSGAADLLRFVDECLELQARDLARVGELVQHGHQRGTGPFVVRRLE